jgi:flagellin-specific chaperone FliS
MLIMFNKKIKKTKEYLKGYNQCFKEKMLEIKNLKARFEDEKKDIYDECNRRSLAEINRIKENYKRNRIEEMQETIDRYENIITHLRNCLLTKNEEIDKMRKGTERMQKDYRKFVDLKAQLNYVIPRISAACEKWSKHTAKEAVRINQEFQDAVDDLNLVQKKTEILENKKFKEINK